MKLTILTLKLNTAMRFYSSCKHYELTNYIETEMVKFIFKCYVLSEHNETHC